MLYVKMTIKAWKKYTETLLEKQLEYTKRQEIYIESATESSSEEEEQEEENEELEKDSDIITEQEEDECDP